MSWTYAEVLQKLGSEAQPVPGEIIVYRGRHITVAKLTNGGSLEITPEGYDILGEAPQATAPEEPITVDKPAAKPRARKVAPVPEAVEQVQSANALAGDPADMDVDDIDLG